MIELKNITALRGRFQLKIADLQLKPGELVAVMGNNGSGKSTFLSVLGGFLKFQGRFLINNRLHQSYHQKQRNRLVGMLPQKTDLNMPFDVFYVVLTGRFPHTDGFRYAREDHRLTEEVLSRFDIAHLKKRPFNQLSGGEKQRVLLARTFNHDAPILLLDEPLNGIDLKHQLETVGHLHDSKPAKTIIVVMHDISLAIREFDRFLVFAEGKLVYDTIKTELNPGKLAEIFQITIDVRQVEEKLYVYTAG